MELILLIGFISVCIATFAIYYAVTCVLNARRERQMQYGLNRHHANPIIKPLAHNHWESEGTFNPGAVVDDTGTIHLFYRAIGKDGISRVGHTTSSDGKLFMNRSAFPVYEPERGYGMPEKSPMNAPHKYDLSAHASGGGWGGAEDPRVVKIDDRIYMTYTAFEGWASMRIGLTSINEKDMEKGQWKWKKPVIISPPGSRAKNWVLFPEKINGKYAILHAIAPKIRVAYVDSPEMAPEIKTVGDHGGGGYEDKGRKESWDHFVRGAGAPPLKTRLGWLLLYHAFDKRNPKKIVGYKVGAMILDLNDPTKVLYRSPQPILSPDMPYENDGKPGVVYASGAIIRDDKLLVYYGGGDKTTCVAETPLDPLLTWLTTYGKI